MSALNEQTGHGAGDLVIGVDGISVQARVGVSEQERAAERTLLIDVRLVPAKTGGLRSDDLEDTADYGQAVRLVAAVVTGGEFRLVEHVAALVADKLLAELPVVEVSVAVRKPSPPTEAPATEAWARVTRRA
jgi:dihydroneopterin aldolase